MSDAVKLDRDTDEFRRAAHEAVDLIADWLASRDDQRVFPDVKPGDVRGALETAPPEQGRPMESLLDEFRRTILPGMTLWNHPAFFAWFAVTGSQAGLLGEMLAATLNVNGMLWRSSPAVAELEEQMMAWLLDALGLPRDWFGIINDTASMNTFLALAAAREATGLQIREHGMSSRNLPPLAVYASDQAHSSVEKGAIALGTGQQYFRRIPSDTQFRMNVGELRASLQRDVGDGVRPMAVVATIGTTSTASVDPLREIAEVAREFGAWLHVDAAYGGAAGLLTEWRWIWDGIGEVDSLVFNPHKWLFTQIDCSVLFTRRPEVLRETFTLVPAYLKTDEQGVTNYMDYGLQLGRRFRSLKLWMVMSHYGLEHMREVIRGHIALAKRFEATLKERDDVEIVSAASMGVVCFRILVRDSEGAVADADSDRATGAFVERVNASGEAFLGTTALRGRTAARVAIGHGQTEWSHLERVLGHLASG